MRRPSLLYILSFCLLLAKPLLAIEKPQVFIFLTDEKDLSSCLNQQMSLRGVPSTEWLTVRSSSPGQQVRIWRYMDSVQRTRISLKRVTNAQLHSLCIWVLIITESCSRTNMLMTTSF